MIVCESKRQVTGSPDVVRYVGTYMAKLSPADLAKEHFWMLTCNARHVIQAMHEISVGCLTTSIVHPREVFRPAVEESAAAILLAHNHPSLDPTPSEEDRKLTDRLVEAGKVLGIKVLDHIIIGDGYISLMDP